MRKEELIALAAREQEAREKMLRAPKYWGANASELKKIHAEVSEKLSLYIEKWGWPGFTAFDKEGALSAATLVQFCFCEPEFMRSCLSYFEQAFRSGDAYGNWFAQYYDTLMYFENKPQVYGTYLDWDAKNQLSPWKIIEPKMVDERRHAILMERLEDYVTHQRHEAKQNNRVPPPDFTIYRQDFENFAVSMGWKRAQAK